MLIVPPSGFARCSENLGALAATGVGVNFTAGASGADGTAVSILSALAHDVHYLVLAIGGINTAAADGNAALDVLSDPAGGTSWGSIIDDLCCGMTPVPSATVGLTAWYYFPLWIKAGTSIGVRAKTAHTVAIATGQVAMWAFGEPRRPEQWWCGQKVETIGIADSKGTAVTPGTSGAFGSWTNIGSASSARFGAVQLGINGSDANALANGWWWQLGVGSVQVPGSPTIYRAIATSEQGGIVGMQPIFCNFPGGTQFQARNAVSSASGEDGYCAVYGVR